MIFDQEIENAKSKTWLLKTIAAEYHVSHSTVINVLDNKYMDCIEKDSKFVMDYVLDDVRAGAGAHSKVSNLLHCD